MPCRGGFSGRLAIVVVSVFDMFKIGIGPSSSHTVGPMRAARSFAEVVAGSSALPAVTRVKAELFGSLGATGHGHGSEAAVLLGLEGERPESVDTSSTAQRVAAIKEHRSLRLGGALEGGGRDLRFDDDDLVMWRNRALPGHPNGMVFTAWAGEEVVARRTYFSIGGGFVLEGAPEGGLRLAPDPTVVPHPFRSGTDLLAVCRDHRLSIPELMWANELSRRPDPATAADEVRAGLLEIWRVMTECIDHGTSTTGVLPGGLKVRRRAAKMLRDLEAQSGLPGQRPDPLAGMDWLTLWALAVNEENAAGGRVVTAPTNGAAGIIPSVLSYVHHFLRDDEQAVLDFLLTAGAIGSIYQQTASISGAEVGCQGEVGVACSMAAAGLTQVRGGTTQQVCNAAEIGLEHHLGLTCDPVGGLVQIPCIERNAVGAIKAVTASRLALAGDGNQVVSLDQVIKTMMQTGQDMKTKYKETARGGLAVNIVEC
ncbi:L-serine ammonia-lyase [Aestuariimicrobium kwangyangense]|uniref:L-serine ammonia-lyase n=1 Tax=Aestuariimicrobium kwangyangense TaxID=396389 RepID=UPI000A05CEF7|nr:L-serine ammonia-lyase [Aestuariimicrobium kwangyangense]